MQAPWNVLSVQKNIIRCIERNIRLATAYFSQGMARRALRLTETVLRSKPTYLDIVEISKLYLEQGYIKRALDLLYPLEPITETSRIFYICTVKLWQIGEHKRCIEFLLNCVEKLPSCHLFKYHLGVIFLRHKKYNRAKQFFEYSLSMKPDYKPAQRCIKYVNSLAAVAKLPRNANQRNASTSPLLQQITDTDTKPLIA